MEKSHNTFCTRTRPTWPLWTDQPWPSWRSQTCKSEYLFCTHSSVAFHPGMATLAPWRSQACTLNTFAHIHGQPSMSSPVTWPPWTGRPATLALLAFPNVQIGIPSVHAQHCNLPFWHGHADPWCTRAYAWNTFCTHSRPT